MALWRDNRRPGAITPLRRPSGVVVGGVVLPAPDEIFSTGLEGWWRGDSVTTTGSAVDQMDDLSGNARHMKQGTPANKPTTTTVGGQDAVRFDPTSDPQYLITDSNHAIGGAPHVLVAVYYNVAAVSAGMTMTIENAALELRQGAASRVQFRVNATSVDGSTSITTSLKAVVCADDGVGSTIYVNNVSDGSNGAATDTPTADQWTLGARDGGTFANNMVLAEALTISGAITAQQRTQLQAYFADRYGL